MIIVVVVVVVISSVTPPFVSRPFSLGFGDILETAVFVVVVFVVAGAFFNPIFADVKVVVFDVALRTFPTVLVSVLRTVVVEVFPAVAVVEPMVLVVVRVALFTFSLFCFSASGAFAAGLLKGTRALGAAAVVVLVLEAVVDAVLAAVLVAPIGAAVFVVVVLVVVVVVLERPVAGLGFGAAVVVVRVAVKGFEAAGTEDLAVGGFVGLSLVVVGLAAVVVLALLVVDVSFLATSEGLTSPLVSGFLSAAFGALKDVERVFGFGDAPTVVLDASFGVDGVLGAAALVGEVRVFVADLGVAFIGGLGVVFVGVEAVFVGVAAVFIAVGFLGVKVEGFLAAGFLSFSVLVAAAATAVAATTAAAATPTASGTILASLATGSVTGFSASSAGFSTVSRGHSETFTDGTAISSNSSVCFGAKSLLSRGDDISEVMFSCTALDNSCA